MAESRIFIRAFLASPGDLSDERVAVRDCVDEINRMVAGRLGCHVELQGWEDTIGGLGRPQELINKDADRCDLFIGMMHKRWGMPPSEDGKFSSGFEEEFERAIARFETTGKPHIQLFFKNIDPDSLKDPGEQLRKVVGFKDRVMAGRQILYKSFNKVSELESLVRGAVYDYVFSLRTQDESRMDEYTTKEYPSEGDSTVIADGSASPITTEGYNFLREFVDKAKDTETYFEISSAEIARLRLLSNLIGTHENDDLYLGVHDINLLYVRKDELDFGSLELFGLLRSSIYYLNGENAPFWYWYVRHREIYRDGVAVIAYAGKSDREIIAAIKVLGLIGRNISELGGINKETLINSWFDNESSSDLRTAALDYLSKYGEKDDIQIAKREYELSNSRTSRKALECVIRINCRIGEVSQALKMLLESQFDSMDEGLLSEVLEALDIAKNEEIMIGLEHQNQDVRLRSLIVLADRGAIGAPEVEKFIEDNAAKIRYAALNILMDLGKEFTEEEAKSILVRPKKMPGAGPFVLTREIDAEGEKVYSEFWTKLLHNFPESELTKKRSEVGIYSPIPYAVLADKYFHKYGGSLREDIDDKFSTYFNECVNDIKSRYSLEDSHELIIGMNNLKMHTCENFTRRALDVLCTKSHPEDLERIRKNLREGYAKRNSLDAQFLLKNGDIGDVQLLLDARPEAQPSLGLLGAFRDLTSYGDIASVAYKYGREDISALFDGGLPGLLLEKILDRCSIAIFKGADDEVLNRLLLHESDAVRRKAALLAVKAFSKARLKLILTAYVGSEGRHFYNTVHWLDLGISLPSSDKKEVLANIKR